LIILSLLAAVGLALKNMVAEEAQAATVIVTVLKPKAVEALLHLLFLYLLKRTPSLWGPVVLVGPVGQTMMVRLVIIQYLVR